MNIREDRSKTGNDSMQAGRWGARANANAAFRLAMKDKPPAGPHRTVSYPWHKHGLKAKADPKI